MRDDTITGRTFAPGTKTRIDLPLARLPGGPLLELPCVVVQGAHDGPRVCLTGAIHGDELNGIEIAREVVEDLDPESLHGTVIAAPLVNVFGALHESRYLPDRRDLNRSFPGSKRGSLASRLAHLLMREVVDGCTWGVDLHTGSDDRCNLPQIRADLTDPQVRENAVAFGTEVVLHAKLRAGSVRAAATKAGCRMLLFETGEALRFDADGIRIGVRGVHRLLHALGALPGYEPAELPEPHVAAKSRWIRAPKAGFARLTVALGDRVEAGERLGVIAGPFGKEYGVLKAREAGVVIGLLQNPVVYQGDAVVHVTRT